MFVLNGNEPKQNRSAVLALRSEFSGDTLQTESHVKSISKREWSIFWACVQLLRTARMAEVS